MLFKLLLALLVLNLNLFKLILELVDLLLLEPHHVIETFLEFAGFLRLSPLPLVVILLVIVFFLLNRRLSIRSIVVSGCASNQRFTHAIISPVIPSVTSSSVLIIVFLLISIFADCIG